MLADAGTAAGPIEIPKGDPGALADAAAAWGRMAHGLAGAAGRVRDGGSTATVAGGRWAGPAAGRFLGYSEDFASTLDTAADGCGAAASAARRFSHDLREAQRAAKRAARQWLEADRERRQASAAADAQSSEAADQRTAASGARTAATTARATPGPAGEAAAQGHDDAAQRADAAAGVAADAARRAAAKAAAAEAEQERAVRAGERANRHAEHAARAAAQAFSHAAGQLRLPANLGDPPVPVTPSSGEANPFGPKAPLFGSPFGGLTPGDIRRVQIEERRKALEDAAKVPQGSIGDGISGVLHDATFGGVDLGGDKTSRRYKGGEAAAMILPLPGGGKLRLGSKALKELRELEMADLARDAKRIDDAGEKALAAARADKRSKIKTQELVRGARQRAEKEIDTEAAAIAKHEANLEIGAKAFSESIGELKNAIPNPAVQALLDKEILAHMVKGYEVYRSMLPAAARARAEAVIAQVRRIVGR